MNRVMSAVPGNINSLAQRPQGDVKEWPLSHHPPPHIRISDLSVSYHGRPVLESVSMDIHRGCITALIGPSGCGKTSFLSSLNRLTDLTPGCVVKGGVWLNERDIHAADIDTLALRQEVGMIFQKPNPFPLSIRRNIEMPLKEHGIGHRADIDQRVEQALRDVGLWDEVRDRLNTSALLLSGGQQQRLCIARALALNPSVLLMDEPCSALDPMSSIVIEELIQRLLPKYTVVIVTHNLAQARRISHHASFFWTRDGIGTVIESGQTKQLFEAPRHELTSAYVSGAKG
jgi:phosphate transport system ATP-binding protein